MEPLSELSFSGGIPEKTYGRRKCTFTGSAWSSSKVFVITSQLILVLLLETHWAGAEEDWPKRCTRNCKCSWVGWKEKADCQGAGFHNIPSGLRPELKVLDLSYNWISQLSQNSFESAGLVKLEKVFLRSSKIEKIDPDAFRSLKIMIELDLTSNVLESIHMEAFKFNEQLRELRLRDNPLTKLHGIQFPALLHLKLLDLSICQLSQLNANTFDKLSNLEQLGLAGNRFQWISEQVFKPLIQLKSLSLENNPWKCDCRLRSFRDWIIVQEFYLVPFTCTEPGRLTDAQWSVLQSIDFACKPEIAALRLGGQATQALTVDADVGSVVTLAIYVDGTECLVRGDPAPEVKWVRNGLVLANSSLNHGRVYLRDISSGGGYVHSVMLTILQPDLDDAGEYVCVGNNPGGVVEKNLILNFQDAPPVIRTTEGAPDLLGAKHEACLHPLWVWVSIGALSSLVITAIAVLVVRFCTVKRRVRAGRAHDLNVFWIERPNDLMYA